MILDNADIELLRLIGWLKNLPIGLDKMFKIRLLASAGTELMNVAGLIATPSKSGFFRLKPQGQILLSSLGFTYPQDSKYVSVDKTLVRRKEAAEIMLTFYRAGYNIFSDVISALQTSNNYLSAMAIRRNEDMPSNIFGGARFAGIGRNNADAYLSYYIDNGKIYHTNERRFFMNAISGLNCNPAAIYFGKTYKQIADIISTKLAKTVQNKINLLTFYEAYRKAAMPIHLIECSDVGASQLLLMGQENYRKRVAELALGEQYELPHGGMTTSDATFKDSNLPVVIGIDMDIKHIRTVHRQAKENGFETIAVIAFKEQLPTLSNLCSSLKLELFGIDRSAILQALNLSLYEPPTVPYITKEGGYIHLETFTKNGKTRKPD